MIYHSKFRVYYEDTDCGGVVYHSNYLNFAERARTEMLRSCDIEQTKLAKAEGLYFVVKNINIEFVKSAILDDEIEIQTKIISINKASMDILQELYVNQQLITKLNVKIVCVSKTDNGLKIEAIPNFILEKLKKYDREKL